MSSNITSRLVNLPANTFNYSVPFNFTVEKVGNGQSFKAIVSHISYYDEIVADVNVWQDTTPPNGTITVTGYSTTSGSNVIQWTPIEGAYKYYIYKGANGQTDFDALKPNATVSYAVTSWVDTNVDVNKWYYYRVAAVDEVGNVGNLSEYVRVIPVNTEQLDEQIQVLQSQLSQYQDAGQLQQQYIILEAQVNADISKYTNDLMLFNTISNLLTPEQYLKVNSILATLRTADSKTDLYERRSFLNQAVYDLNQFTASYSVGQQSLTYSDNLGNLSVSTNEELVTVSFDNNDYYRFIVNKTIANPMQYAIQDINLLFSLPGDAILVDDLNVIDGSIIYNISSLSAGESATFSYTYYSYSSYTNDAVAGFMTEIIPATPLGPITGFVVFEDSQPDETYNAAYIVAVWALVIVAAASYFQKSRILSLYSKVKGSFKKHDDSDDNMIEIKI